jgi:hypothetical protein
MKRTEIDPRLAIAWIFCIGLAMNVLSLYIRLHQPDVDMDAFNSTFVKVATIYSAPLGIVLAKIFGRGWSRRRFNPRAAFATLLVAAWNVGVLSVTYAQLAQPVLRPDTINGALDAVVASTSFLTAGLLSLYFDSSSDRRSDGSHS